MRKFLLLSFLVAAVSFGAVEGVNAQKIGYVDTDAILAKLPAVKQANSRLEALGKQLESQIQTKYTAIQTVYNEAMEKGQQGLLNPKQQQDYEARLAKMQEDLQKLQQKSQQDLAVKEQELLKPIVDKVNKAIEDVAKAKGYAMILNVNLVLYKDGSGDLTKSVASKLGVTL